MIKATLKALSLALTLGVTLPAFATIDALKEVHQTAPAAKTSQATEGHAAVDNAAALVSINSASAEELVAALNGIGSKKAESIVSYREKYGPFSQLEQLKEVPGIGNALVERNISRMKL